MDGVNQKKSYEVIERQERTFYMLNLGNGKVNCLDMLYELRFRHLEGKHRRCGQHYSYGFIVIVAVI